MKVRELIEQLQKFDPEQIVVTDGYESGFDEIKEVRYITGLSYYPSDGDKNWYDGEYQKESSLGIESDNISAVYLPRSS
ncbi:MAG: hypothetical protein EB127_30635 [Alphaproteobacteria bacterium]|nr:hypothetical protein [Alphaproteobacteria bacterium]